MCFIDSEEKVQYVKNVISSSQNCVVRAANNEKKSFEKVKPLFDQNFIIRIIPLEPDFLKLMVNLIQFNPYMRWSAQECLDFDSFDEFRNK